ncbi:pancreatic lipase-related protein 2-like isoform X2 [Ischnura elegans]|nr:pancreatic lipase-related protein 2-like isoform X2 [Ischnura elegans]XP_046392758.1 pancreatic lipase-related protein 2-like isoform X2 [Ischnura elegans]XP_046392767.1 pancreatic lipase-related protein 2-like isoform X2 [Ischnura elegans]
MAPNSRHEAGDGRHHDHQKNVALGDCSSCYDDRVTMDGCEGDFNVRYQSRKQFHRGVVMNGLWFTLAIAVMGITMLGTGPKAAEAATAVDLLTWAGRSVPQRLQDTVPWIPSDNETQCYEELGCLALTKEWYHLIYRPFNVFPLPRRVINTRFILYTRRNPSEGQVLSAHNDQSIRKSHFDPTKPTKVIIHGFIDTPLSSWVKELRRELLKAGDWNIIVVDWAGGSLPLYTQATANTRLVGLELGFFINYLQKNFGLEPRNVHMIGHSLGAHTAGYAGERIKGLGRITGLDPAEPYFQGMPPFVRLDPGDAEFVDVIHTDGRSILLLGYGMSQPCGHADFYPNNGKEQPGCDLVEATAPLPLTLVKEGLEEASRVLVACNHIRAIKLFIDSINSQCPYVAHNCESYEHYLQGRCYSCQETNSCAVMGLHALDNYVADPPLIVTTTSKPNNVNETNVLSNTIDANFSSTSTTTTSSTTISTTTVSSTSTSTTELPPLPRFPMGKFYISTGKDFPYCRRHYRVRIELARPPRAEAWVQGYLKLSLASDNAAIKDIDLTPGGYIRLQHGESKTFVVSHSTDVGPGPVRKVELNWEYDGDMLSPRSLCLFFWCNDHLYVSQVEVSPMDLAPTRGKREIDGGASSKLCSLGKRGYSDIASRSSGTFYDNC